MRIRKLYLFLGGGVVLLGALAGWQLQGPVLPAYELSLRPLQQVVVATGRVSALSRTQIGAEITGVVLERRVQEGDVVKAGDVLVVLRSEGVCARAGRAWRETVHSFRSMSGAVLAALVTFFLINLTTKGALASAEAQLAPDFAESTELSDDSSELPAVLEENTAIFAIALGGVGLLAYVLVICKPKRGKRASGSGERAGLLAATSGAPPPRARCGWATTYADELDVWLLLASLLCTAVGALLLSGTPPLPIPILSAGMVLVWSLGGPVADVLSVSTVSIALSQLAPGSQAMSMAALSLAGSVGRIAWPLGVVWMGDTASSLASAAVCALSAVALVALLVRYPEMPGSAALRCCCGRRGGVYTQL